MAWEWKMAARLIRRWQKKPSRVVERVATIEGTPEATMIKVGKESFVASFSIDDEGSLFNDLSTLEGIEKKLRSEGVTHCVDLEADNERVPIDEFLQGWRSYLEQSWEKPEGLG